MIALKYYDLRANFRKLPFGGNLRGKGSALSSVPDPKLFYTDTDP